MRLRLCLLKVLCISVALLCIMQMAGENGADVTARRMLCYWQTADTHCRFAEHLTWYCLQNMPLVNQHFPWMPRQVWRRMCELWDRINDLLGIVAWLVAEGRRKEVVIQRKSDDMYLLRQEIEHWRNDFARQIGTLHIRIQDLEGQLRDDSDDSDVWPSLH